MPAFAAGRPVALAVEAADRGAEGHPFGGADDAARRRPAVGPGGRAKGGSSWPIPGLCQGAHFPSFPGPKGTAEKTLLAAIGTPPAVNRPQAVHGRVPAMGGAGASVSEVGPLRAKEIDGRGDASSPAPLAGAWPCPWLDATSTGRDGGRIVGRATMIGVDEDGRRAAIGVATTPFEPRVFRMDLPSALADPACPA